MKSWKKVVSKWLLALLIVDSVATPVLALSETTTEGVRIRDTYIKDYKEDASKLSLTIDKGQTNTEQLVVKLKAEEGEINEQGLTLILQSGLALGQNDQGQAILPEGFYRDEAYNENDRKVASAGSDALAVGLEQLPVYGEGYYSLKIKPSADRSITLNTDPNDSSKRFEEHVFVFKKVAEVQTGEMVAMTNEHYLTILKENQSVFTNQETTELNASTEIPRGPGSITIQLRAYEENNPDPQVPLTDSEFEISSVDHPEQRMTGKTDQNGNVTFENITLGTYNIRQISSASDYNVVEQIETVELTESEPSKTVRVINHSSKANQTSVATEIPRGPGSITIQLRAYEENNPDPQVPLTESEFEISSVDHPEQTMDGKTDLNGNVTFENIALGTYNIRQISSASDYNVVEQIETVELTESEPSKTVRVINQPKASLARATRRSRSVSERAAVNTTLAPGVETYGITYANIDVFGYYQFQDGYSTYGAGMDVRWKLPAEAKEGDYFTLNFGNQILLNRAPMYDEGEEVPYGSLDSVGNRYPETHIGNLFFQIVTRQSSTEPTGIPILNVYYTKAGELTFVVQKYANDKGPIEGEAIIGKLVDKYNLTAVTDGNGRHRSSKRIRPAGNGATDSRLDWDIYDLDDQIKKYDFYEGFYPNYMLMTEQAGATPTNGDPWFLGRSITYTSQYMNGTPIDLQDANGEPSKSGVYINQRTQLFETTHDFGSGNRRTSSYGRDALFPVYEDRTYLYYYFVYNGNKNATGRGAWEVYLRPAGSELEIVDVKLFQGYNGQYASKQATSMVPPMATVDPNNPEAGQQVSTGKRFSRYNATEWKADWGGSEQLNTYFAIIKARKKTPSPEVADLNRLGYHMGMHSRQDIFGTREIIDYYVPTEGFGAGWVVPEEPKDLLGNFKIQKTDPNKTVVYPNYQKVGDVIQYQDDHGNTYTYNSATKKYVDNRGQSLSQKTDNQGNLLFEDNLHKVFTQKKNGSTITYTDADGIVYSKKAGEEDIYTSPDGKVFRPSRPLLKDYDVTIKVEGTVVTDSGGKVYPLASQNNGILDVVDRFGNLLRIQNTNTGLIAWKYDSGQKAWVNAPVTRQANGYYTIAALPITSTRIHPKLTETFSFKITDTITGLAFNHEVDEYGYAIFPSLLVGHTYRLEETSARVGYTRTPKVYLLTVTAVGQVSITDESGTPISTTTDPLSIVDANNLLYSVVNEVVRLKIKKTDEDGRLITSDKATFKVYKSGDYTRNNNTIQPNTGAVPVATIQTSKADGTATLYGESEAVVIPNIMTNVNYGIVEETAPAGYRILTTGIEVKLVQSGSNYVWQLVSGGNNASLESDNLTLKVKNRADLANLVITKKIKGLESLNDLITSPVTFKLTKLNDTSFNPITLRQNANTRFVFNNLSEGVYRLEETEPPTGYVKSSTPYTVIVDKGRADVYQSGQGTTTQATGLKVIKSNHFDNDTLWGANSEDKAIDGNENTVALYNLGNSQLEEGQWWGVDLGAIKNVSRIRYLQGPAGGNGSERDRMDSLELEYSVDGQNYQSLGTYNASTGASLGEVLKDTEVMARYIRVRNRQVKNGVWLAIKEMTITTRNPITPLVDGAVAIGNIQNPKLRIEKQDTNGQVISQNVTFKLYKVDDATTEATVGSALQNSIPVQTFTLQNGSLTTPMDVNVLGRYALVETQAPTGYTGLAAPVLLELYEASQPHNDQLNKAVTRFRVLSQTDKVTVDDSTTATDNTLKMVVKNVRNTFNLKLLKRDLANQNTGLNARFELYDANETAVISQGNTTQTGNSLTFQNLQPGIYVLKEVTPPSGYIQVDPVRLEITQAGQLQILSGDTELLQVGASSGNTLELTVKNDSKKTLRISKRIKGLESLASLITGNMTFTLSKDNDTSFQPVTITQAANTDFVFNNLTYGSYTLVETAPPAGYMAEPITYKVSVSRSGVSLYKVANVAPSERVAGATLIKSGDLSNIQSGQDGNAIDGNDTTAVTYSNFNGQGNNIPAGAYLGVDLQGVKRVRRIHYLQGNQNNPLDRFNRFTLEYSIDGRTYFPLSTYPANGANGLVDLDTDIVARYIRVRNEEQVVNKWYVVRELTVSAQATETVSALSTGQYPIGNIQHPQIQVEKRDMSNARINQSVTFELYKVDDATTTANAAAAIQGSNPVQTFTLTNGQESQALQAKVLGRYALVEVAPPTGYRALAGPVLLDLTTAQETHSGSQMKTVSRFSLVDANDKVTIDTATANVLKIFVKNELITYNLLIKKRDLNNTETGLNARFELYDANETAVISQGNTTQTGNSLTFQNLQPGIYVLKEVTPPSGYIQVDPVRLEITQAGQLRILSGDTELLQVGASSGNTLQLTVKNDSKKTLRISKRIKGLEDLPSLITGQMTFTLTKDNDATAVSAVQTHAATEDFVFTNLTYGSYTLVETAPPAGYMVEPITYKVSVSRSGVSLYKVANAAPSERVAGATLFKSPDLSNIQSGQDGNAIDGSDTTSVTYKNFNGQGDNIPAGAYLGVDLQGVKRVRHIRYYQGTQRNAYDRFNRFTLEYSIDGRTYFPLSTYTESGLVNLNTDIVARYIRVRNEDRVEQRWYAVRELTVSAQATETVNALSAGQYPIGNIQHPEIQIEKQDMNNSIIQQAVTFKLYKVPDDATSQTVTGTLTDQNLVQTFTLTNGQVRQTLEAKVLGRYALVEVAPPTGYRALAGPVLLDLTTAQETHSGSQMKTVSRFTLVDSTDKVTIDTATANVLKIFVKNELLTYNLLIKKRDLANPNTGLDARFELYNENESTKLEQGNTTQTGNSLTFRNLRPGTYVLKEVTAPTGYNPIQKIKLTISLDGQITIVEGPQDLLEGQAVNANNEIELVVKNRPFTDFSIEKVSNLDPTSNLAGVQLQIKAKNNGPAPLFSDDNWHIQHYQATIDTANKALTWWTQSNDVGNAVFKLPQGTYTISELAAPAGYELLQPFDIIVGADGQVRLADGAPTNAEINTKDNRLNLKLTNIFKPKLKIIKVDSRDANRKLAGARFKLFGPNENTQIGQEVTTDSNGEITLPGLEPGTYYLQETQSPAGFQTNGTKYKLIIATDGTTTVENADDLIAVAPLSDDKVISITLKNNVKTYRLKIKKRDYDQPNNGVSGARFALYPSEGPNADGSNKVQVLINGRMTALEGSSYSHLDNTIDFPNIPPGEYVLRETQAPSGYTKIRDTRLRIGEDGRLTLLDADQALVSVETGQGDTLVMVAKNIRTFNFQVKKIDSANETTLLDNARFSIYKTDVNWTKGDTALAQGLTRAGIYQTNLEPGYYILKEDQAPSGYLLNQQEYRFQINHDGSIYLHNPDATVSLAPADTNRLVVFTMKNTRITSQFKLAKRSYRDSAQRLEATFELKESGNAQAPAVVKRTTTTGDEVLFDNLPVGKSYILKETVAPDGYQKIEKEIHIDIGADGAITIRDGGDLVSLDNTDSHLIIVKNLRKGEYPKTGGIGIIPYIALGGVMMLLALAVELGKEKRWKHIRK
ncbi:TPA: discoidin domain-containing protein [Streptococcus suis]|nr:discoidin domain-containing protein [Streptococcus suis]